MHRFQPLIDSMEAQGGPVLQAQDPPSHHVRTRRDQALPMLQKAHQGDEDDGGFPKARGLLAVQKQAGGRSLLPAGAGALAQSAATVSKQASELIGTDKALDTELPSHAKGSSKDQAEGPRYSRSAVHRPTGSFARGDAALTTEAGAPQQAQTGGSSNAVEPHEQGVADATTLDDLDFGLFGGGSRARAPSAGRRRGAAAASTQPAIHPALGFDPEEAGRSKAPEGSVSTGVASGGNATAVGPKAILTSYEFPGSKADKTAPKRNPPAASSGHLPQQTSLQEEAVPPKKPAMATEAATTAVDHCALAASNFPQEGEAVPRKKPAPTDHGSFWELGDPYRDPHHVKTPREGQSELAASQKATEAAAQQHAREVAQLKSLHAAQLSQLQHDGREDVREAEARCSQAEQRLADRMGRNEQGVHNTEQAQLKAQLAADRGALDHQRQTLLQEQQTFAAACAAEREQLAAEKAAAASAMEAARAEAAKSRRSLAELESRAMQARQEVARLEAQAAGGKQAVEQEHAAIAAARAALEADWLAVQQESSQIMAAGAQVHAQSEELAAAFRQVEELRQMLTSQKADMIARQDELAAERRQWTAELEEIRESRQKWDADRLSAVRERAKLQQERAAALEAQEAASAAQTQLALRIKQWQAQGIKAQGIKAPLVWQLDVGKQPAMLDGAASSDAADLIQAARGSADPDARPKGHKRHHRSEPRRSRSTGRLSRERRESQAYLQSQQAFLESLRAASPANHMCIPSFHPASAQTYGGFGAQPVSHPMPRSACHTPQTLSGRWPYPPAMDHPSPEAPFPYANTVTRPSLHSSTGHYRSPATPVYASADLQQRPATAPLAATTPIAVDAAAQHAQRLQHDAGYSGGHQVATLQSEQPGAAGGLGGPQAASARTVLDASCPADPPSLESGSGNASGSSDGDLLKWRRLATEA
ncbi:hypothetical protein WJX72_002952 [[Myrmecia] bisecta]|uniref:Uncharacterized protein n=1 Tax=[Myrmecia] bisecta TaxID=41462 RepID=A0AAW1R5D8_9CHLO